MKVRREEEKKVMVRVKRRRVALRRLALSPPAAVAFYDRRDAKLEKLTIAMLIGKIAFS